MKVLLIEDDKQIANTLKRLLKEKNIILDWASDGEKGLQTALINKYDLILLDYNLPLLNGRQIIEKLRQEKIMIPIIMLTVRAKVEDKVDILNSGADDYLTKPFSFCELLARIKAVARRPIVLKEKRLNIKNLELFPDKFLVKRNGKNIRLRAKEFALLEYLMTKKGYFVSRQEIMENVWDENADPFSNTIEVHIMKLRKKIENKNQHFIFTMPNRGYKVDEKA
ncbi:MAG: response regulator transcription factor [Patescibacteria group bacterium]|jgi:DNA-binding response OmpR family regulator|nr:MAG: Transcriptional regulatory protein CusR [Parcubacteria group bacterium ADurb.Bin159]HPY08639.1 response regulator transcription factor [bacterium]HQC49770.1 response regulator transcription factor [bacterium]